MNTFLCTIDLQPNILSSDRLSIALIMANEHTLLFKYSENKLNAVKHLFSPEAFNILKIYLTSLEESFNSHNQELLKKWVNEGYLSYLEKYNNNLVLFSKTKKVNVPLNRETFGKFFEMYIFPSENNYQTEEYSQENLLTDILVR